jgi:AbiJ N-terminal domain 4
MIKYLPEHQDIKLEYSIDKGFLHDLLDDFFGKKVHYSEFLEHILDTLEEYYDELKWYEVYDLLEFVADYLSKHNVSRLQDPEKLMSGLELKSRKQLKYVLVNRNMEFIQDCNKILNDENTAYRFIGNVISTITSEEEIKEVDKAMPFENCGEHLNTALQLLSYRKNPKFRESIASSIKAIECISQKICGKNVTFTEAMKTIENKLRINIPPPLSESFKKLYGFASAYDIRHSRGVMNSNDKTCSIVDIYNSLVIKKEVDENVLLKEILKTGNFSEEEAKSLIKKVKEEKIEDGMAWY